VGPKKKEKKGFRTSQRKERKVHRGAKTQKQNFKNYPLG